MSANFAQHHTGPAAVATAAASAAAAATAASTAAAADAGCVPTINLVDYHDPIPPPLGHHPAMPEYRYPIAIDISSRITTLAAAELPGPCRTAGNM